MGLGRVNRDHPRGHDSAFQGRSTGIQTAADLARGLGGERQARAGWQGMVAFLESVMSFGAGARRGGV